MAPNQIFLISPGGVGFCNTKAAENGSFGEGAPRFPEAPSSLDELHDTLRPKTNCLLNTMNHQSNMCWSLPPSRYIWGAYACDFRRLFRGAVCARLVFVLPYDPFYDRGGKALAVTPIIPITNI